MPVSGKKKDTATKAGNGNTEKGHGPWSNPPAHKSEGESVIERKCIMCPTKTTAPYGNTHDKQVLCSKSCSEKYYANEGTGGAWGMFVPAG